MVPLEPAELEAGVLTMRRIRGRRGFTLIEIMAAIVILAFVLVGMVAATANFLRLVGRGDRRTAANELAEDRIEQIKMEPKYTKLDSLFSGTETDFPTLPGYSRTTTIVQVGGPTDVQDHKVATVVVNGPGLSSPVKRTVIVGVP